MRPSLSISLVSAGLVAIGAVVIGCLRARPRTAAGPDLGPRSSFPSLGVLNRTGGSDGFGASEEESLLDRLRQRGF